MSTVKKDLESTGFMKCKFGDRQTELRTAALVFTGQYVCLSLCERRAAISSALSCHRSLRHYNSTFLQTASPTVCEQYCFQRSITIHNCIESRTPFVLATLPMHMCSVLQPNRCCQYAAGWGSLSGESGSRLFLPVLCISSWLDGSISVSIIDGLFSYAHRYISDNLGSSINVSVVDRPTIV